MSNLMKIEIDDAFESTYLSSKFRFTFDNIPELRKLYPAGKRIYSEIIKDISQFMNADVRVSFCPCGSDSSNADQNYGSIYLRITPKNMEECFYVKHSFNIVAANKKDLECVFEACKAVSHDSRLSWGRVKFIKLVNDDKIRESLTVEMDIKIFTERSYLRWLKLYPDEEIQVDSSVMYNNAIAFDNQDYDEDDNSVSSIEVNVDGKASKIFDVSHEIVCNVSDVFKTRLTDKKLNKGSFFEYDRYYNSDTNVSGYSPELVNKFLKSIHTRILRYDDWEDLLYLLEISNEYQVIWIKNEVCQLIENGLKIENGIQSFIRADLSDAKELREKCLELCIKSYPELKVTDEWQELKKNHVNLLAEIVMSIKNEACTFIENGLKIETGIQPLVRADVSGSKELREKCLEFCVKNYHQLKVTDEWKQLKKDHANLMVEILEKMTN